MLIPSYSSVLTGGPVHRHGFFYIVLGGHGQPVACLLLVCSTCTLPTNAPRLWFLEGADAITGMVECRTSTTVLLLDY